VFESLYVVVDINKTEVFHKKDVLICFLVFFYVLPNVLKFLMYFLSKIV
jgi:hypothetical protein